MPRRAGRARTTEILSDPAKDFRPRMGLAVDYAAPSRDKSDWPQLHKFAQCSESREKFNTKDQV
jgi:hypothetical protein